MKSDKSSLSPEELAYELPGMWTEDWFSADDNIRVKEITRYIPGDVQQLLDAGCGNGLFLHYLRDHCPNIKRLCGAERSASAIAHVATEKFQASIDSMPFGDAEFDMVTSLEVLEHLPGRVLTGAVKEISRIAKRYIIITVPYAQDLSVGMTICPACYCRFNADYHVRSFDEQNLSQLFDGDGFRCRDVFYIRPRFVFHDSIAHLIDAARMLKHRVRGLGNAYPAYAVCPACGFQDANKSLTGTSSGSVNGRISFQQRLVQALSWKRSHRWIGAIFDRE
jgi:SAM-dependent methyltransferase